MTIAALLCRLVAPTRLAGVALSAAAGCSAALAYPSFQVNESAIPGTGTNVISVDRMGVSYASQIFQQVAGGLGGGDDPFREVGYLQITGYGNGAAILPAYLNGMGSTGYGLYATFSIDGETDPGASSGSVHARFLSGHLTLWADVNSNTVLGLAGTGSGISVQGSSVSDDVALGTALLTAGEARLFTSMVGGSFSADLRLTLNGTGQQLFQLGGGNFYEYLHLSGNKTWAANPAGVLGSGGTVCSSGAGTLSASPFADVNAVPEPSSALLLATALMCLALTWRRGQD
ncbi:flocculation-associated PEP-CTERM protein PepA [Azohydromonas aeria]|uniref:flocculation-associated PEP-CTERM protein PepA n=1 Tax=Azohydromonas aeria TaxID=2590212 RepID=UPI0012FB4F05|nr:flocculation-associated PEP-CTERM protein PepA [Azohydromonas aeria]